jgi:primosomal protein N' (replication factor Y)
VLEIAAEQLGRNLRAVFGNRVLGPEEPIVSRVQNLYIRDILIKLERNANLAKAKDLISDQLRLIMEYKPFRGLIVLPDVDPM